MVALHRSLFMFHIDMFWIFQLQRYEFDEKGIHEFLLSTYRIFAIFLALQGSDCTEEPIYVGIYTQGPKERVGYFLHCDFDEFRMGV